MPSLTLRLESGCSGPLVLLNFMHGGSGPGPGAPTPAWFYRSLPTPAVGECRVPSPLGVIRSANTFPVDNGACKGQGWTVIMPHYLPNVSGPDDLV